MKNPFRKQQRHKREKPYPEIRRIKKGSTVASYRLVKHGKGDFLPDKNCPGEYAIQL
jgi:hypothetical protein